MLFTLWMCGTISFSLPLVKTGVAMFLILFQPSPDMLDRNIANILSASHLESA